MKILMAGDTHGKQYAILPKIEIAEELGIQKILQVGDFGLWDHYFDGVVFLDEVQEAAKKAKLTVHAIGGNHENWDHWELYVANMPTSSGWAMVRSRVALAPKVHKWTWDNKQFIGAGGAVSIDKDFYRLPREAGTYIDEYGRRLKATGPRTLYWPNETLTEDDVLTIEHWNRKADFLITHDCSNNTPWGTRLKNDPDSELHRRKIDRIIKTTKPDLHFHGHMHTKYDWVNNMSSQMQHDTQTYGLEADDDKYSWGVLDTSTGEFTWSDEVV